jgi:gas vesicle protein
VAITLSLVMGRITAGGKQENQRKKGEFNMEEQGTKINFLKGLLIGGALGALAGILFAPKSGKELRSDIKKKGNEIIKDGKEIYADASAKAKEIYAEVKHQAKDWKRDAEDAGEKMAGEVHEKVGQVKKVFGKT